MLDRITDAILLALMAIAFLFAALLLLRWAVRDARRRHKSPILVAIAVTLFFPWGLIAWLAFRPVPLRTYHLR